MSTFSTPSARTANPVAVKVLGAGLAYFGVVFAVGIVLGYLRETYVAPFITSDLAVVVEAPLMAVVVWQAARLVVGWLGDNRSAMTCFFVGLIGLALVVGGEDLLSRGLRGESVFDHWALYGYLAMAATLAGLTWLLFAPLRAGRRP